MTNLIGLHDAEAQTIAAPDSWIVHTVALSENPAPAHLDPRFAWIVRLNEGYGTTGTLPAAEHYADFAATAARFVASSTGCTRWIIGNETNLPREWPDHQPIAPWDYAHCFRLCRNAIRNLRGHAHDEVLVAGSGPWNNQFDYPGNPTGDWITYFADVLAQLDGDYDGFALHAYTHGYDPALVASEAKMDAPFQDRHYHFRTYRDYCAAVPAAQRHKPAYLTEANGDGPWHATGLMPAMLGEIDGWNQDGHTPRIHCVAFYRWPKYDTFYIEGKGDVIAEYQRAVQLGYSAPGEVAPPPITEPSPPPLDEPVRAFDPALLLRGVEVTEPALAPGEQYWFAEHLEWLDRQESGGRHHIYGNVTDAAGADLYGVKLKVSWPSGDALIETKPDAATPYTYNYPMSKSLNEFRIEVLDGSHKSELVTGLGMGMDGNPAEHTSTVIRWTLRTHERTPITPPPIEIPQPPDLVPATGRGQWPVPGGIITGRFGQVYTFDDGTKTTHNGLDIGAPAGTPVLCTWDGVVKWVDWDNLYGNYCRVYHPAQRLHSFFAHLRDPASVKAGDKVQAGQTLGYVGMTGNQKNTGNHLHYELRTGHGDAYVNTSLGYTYGRSNPEALLHSYGVRPDSAGAGLRSLTLAAGEPETDDVPF